MELPFKNPKTGIIAAIIFVALVVAVVAGGERIGTYVVVVFFVLAGVAVAYATYVRWKIHSKGVETDAVVTSVETQDSTDADGFTSTEFYYHVRYQNQAGESVDGVLQFFVSGRKKLQPGDRVKIKYLPDLPQQPIMTKKL